MTPPSAAILFIRARACIERFATLLAGTGRSEIGAGLILRPNVAGTVGKMP